MVNTERGRLWTAIAVALTVALSSAGSQAAGAAASSASRPAANSATYEAVLDGMACKQQKSGRMDCDYRVGRAVRFLIAGVGQEDVLVSFIQADSSAEYAASFVPLHGCVVVKPVRPADGRRALQVYAADSVATFAFVSPKTGRVYRTWAMCLTATRNEARAETKVDPKADTAKSAVTKVPVPEAKSPPPSKPPR